MRHRVHPTELLVRQHLQALTRSLPGAQKGEAPVLHRARVATRRLRELLPVVLPGSRGRKLERKVRRLTRAMGPVRELDVVMQILDELNAADDAPRAGIARLRQVIRQEHQKLHTAMRHEVARIDIDKLRRRMTAASRKERVRTRGRARAPRRLASAHERAARRAIELRDAIENAGSIYLPDRLHEVRVAVKKLRYASEVETGLSGSRAVVALRKLKEAQDLLGRMHDLEVLIARVRAVQASRAPNLRLSSDLDRLVRRLETECRQLHGHYMTLRKGLLAICDRAETSPAGPAKSRVSSAA